MRLVKDKGRLLHETDAIGYDELSDRTDESYEYAWVTTGEKIDRYYLTLREEKSRAAQRNTAGLWHPGRKAYTYSKLL
ncbi:uncharacterized protein PHALS_12014 [Plasmopara halstedii]|uniref:Uncharacterized protein n=1 Tax=Plasmopara halstedii TaxID=4781 RepID=A0A0P1AKN2_PLAHL|nr:uncharacterized protein PHALS_12014 [Plasmopara halstedii]CEG41678.1 hypothetical protein PHALS_12014 [Plasmopara halstedii]|eukprot:XP_024578047.1 hypothetical protein PHALS_12014 [Plasmopara halstedii]